MPRVLLDRYSPKPTSHEMVRVAVMPIRRRPGLSEVQYRCTECSEVAKQTEDDRFRD
jgi:hypothetical protein